MIDGGLKDEHRSAIIDTIAANDRVERAVLFGSRAMGTNTVASDVDIALYGDSLTLTDQARLAEAIDDIPMAQSVELVLYDSINNPAFRDHVRTHGVEWYRRAKAGPLHLLPEHRQLLDALLRKHLPDVEAWAYGSRVNGRSHDGSDLDLVLRGPGLKKIPTESLAAFEDAVRESNIPFPIEARDWARLPKRFHREIEREHVVLTKRGKPQIDEGWREHLLGDLTDNFDYIRVPVKQAERRTGPYPYYGASGIIDYIDDYLFDGEYLLIAEDGENLRTRNTPIAFLASGKFWVNNHAHIVRGNQKADTRYLMYALSALDVSGYLTGSTMPKLTQGNLDRISLFMPPLPEQRTIARVLGRLDDKLELNRRMNETLEAMARALFNSWFVDFAPVRAKTEGRDPELPQHVGELFPNSFVDSEFGKIPHDWEIGELGDYVDVVKGVSYKGSGLRDDGMPLHNLNSINEGGGYKYDGIKYYTGEYQERHVVRPGDLIVANTEQGHDRLLVGYSALIPDMFGNRGIASHHVFIVRPKPDSPLTSAYLCHLFNSTQMHDVVSRYANGTTVNMLPFDSVLKPRILCPPKSLVATFDSLASTVYGQRNWSVSESMTLRSLRNSILPLLVSGELRVRRNPAPFERKDS